MVAMCISFLSNSGAPRPAPGKSLLAGDSNQSPIIPRRNMKQRENHSVLFELDRVTLSRGGRTVLRDVAARLPKGASCVAGPSGSGKSTLLRLLNRLADPDHGIVK